MDYMVQPGDSLWRIAAKHLGSGTAWPAIATDNHCSIINACSSASAFGYEIPR
jgi:nucleoid-associated protein YgaU